MDTRRHADATTFEEACAEAWCSDLILLVLAASAALRRFTDGSGTGHRSSEATPATAS